MHLVKQAYEGYVAIGAAREDERERARAWLEQRGAEPPGP